MSATLKPAPAFCDTCGAALELRVFTTSFNLETRRPEQDMFLACPKVPANVRSPYGYGHSALAESRLDDGGFAVPYKMALFYDLKLKRKGKAARARQEPVG